MENPEVEEGMEGAQKLKCLICGEETVYPEHSIIDCPECHSSYSVVIGLPQ